MSATYNTVDTRFILFRIADAIEAGTVVVGVNASVGRYQTATGNDAQFRVIPRNVTAPDTGYDGSIDAAHRFIYLEGEGNAARALTKANS